MPQQSFIDVPRDSHFPIQNLPFGVFQPGNGKARIGVAIGELVLDLSILEEKGLLAVEAAVLGGKRTDVPPGSPSRTGIAASAGLFAQDSLNAFLALGRPAWRKARETIQHL